MNSFSKNLSFGVEFELENPQLMNNIYTHNIGDMYIVGHNTDNIVSAAKTSEMRRKVQHNVEYKKTVML